MKKELMNILVCPICKGQLHLEISEEDAMEIISGSLTCSSCKESFPIKDSIPNLLPPDMRTPK